jgi:hypothetical protein
MPFTQWMPLVAAAAVVSFFVVAGARTETRLPWQLPAAVSATFLAFSLVAVVTEGGMGFWPVHTHNLWGNQVWVDLLLAATVAWVALLPRARAAGMNGPAWIVAVLATGSIGLTAMLARLLYLERPE